MLSVASLAFGFPGRTIGRDVSFALEAGEVMCVLGPNGGGKTTLFRTLLGLLAPHGGTIKLDSAPLENLSRPEIARRVGYVPQGHTGYFAFTVREFVLMGRTAHLGIFSAPGRKDLAIASRVLESLGIAHLADKPVTEISGGERQLALVARALAQEPKLLVLDEPTATSTSATRCACCSASRRWPAPACRSCSRATTRTTPSCARAARCCSPRAACSRSARRAR